MSLGTGTLFGSTFFFRIYFYIYTYHVYLFNILISLKKNTNKNIIYLTKSIILKKNIPNYKNCLNFIILLNGWNTTFNWIFC